MPKTFIVAGTDTDVGKTVFCAMLTLALDGYYWKPVQCGTEDGGDSRRVKDLTGLEASRVLPERYVFSRPLSPHRAAELDGARIDLNSLNPLPRPAGALIIEAAGGLLVPLTSDFLQIDLFKSWKAPVILCARTSLGTINHSLLSVEALSRRGVPLLGIAFIGDPNEDSERIILSFSKTHRLGRLPRLERISREALLAAFEENFRREDFS